MSTTETAEFSASYASVLNPKLRIKCAVDWLRVDLSERYRPTAEMTFCNVYAHDVACLLGTYLPRVWWTDRAIQDYHSGIRVDASVGKTVREMTANRLFDWLSQYGASFGWRRLADANSAQFAANSGELVLVCAKAAEPRTHGHISVIVAEHKGLIAERKDGRVISPVQSQAGRQNLLVGLAGPWWSDFEQYSFWGVQPVLDAAHVRATVRTGGSQPSVRPNLAGGILAALSVLFLSKTVHRLDSALDRLVHEELTSTPISSKFVDALVAGEDRRFFRHRGVDYRAIVRAIIRRISAGSIQGASTIEQQLVRTLTDRRAPTAWRKLTEIMLASHLARHRSKRAVANAYLRVAYFGWQMNGIAQACRRLHIQQTSPSTAKACELIAALRYPIPRSPSADFVETWKRRSRYIFAHVAQTEADE